MNKPLLFALLLIGVLAACRQNSSPLEEIDTPFRLLSPSEAESYILNNEGGFFDRITTLDMELQLGAPEENKNRELVLENYKTNLKKELSAFSDSEKTRTRKAIHQALMEWERLFPKIKLDTVYLVKIDGRSYGDGVYYTRGKAIFIPENELQNKELEGLKSVLFHELVHLASDQFPEWMKKNMDIVGAARYPKWKLQYANVSLANKQLLNPDGLMLTTFRLTSNGESVLATPIVYSKENPTYEGFMRNIQFNLFPVKVDSANQTLVVTGDAVDDGFMSDFHNQIGDNTTYIIHPDEIIAENLRLISDVEFIRKPLNELSKDGRDLLVKFKKNQE